MEDILNEVLSWEKILMSNGTGLLKQYKHIFFSFI